jgi:hypothetical protein
MKLTTPPECQGQIVIVSHGWCGGRLYRHVYDQSDREEVCPMMMM